MKSEIVSIWLFIACVVYTVLVVVGFLVIRMSDSFNDYAFLLLIVPTAIIPWLVYMPYKVPQVVGVVLSLMAIIGMRATLNNDFPQVWEKSDLYFLLLIFVLGATAGLRIHLWIRG